MICPESQHESNITAWQTSDTSWVYRWGNRNSTNLFLLMYVDVWLLAKLDQVDGGVYTSGLDEKTQPINFQPKNTNND